MHKTIRHLECPHFRVLLLYFVTIFLEARIQKP